MKLKLYLIFLILFVSYANAQKRCNLVEIDLEQRVHLSSIIVEGKILNAESVWDKGRKNIYTIYTIDVSGVFKGNVSSQINIVVPGGTIDLKKHIFSSSVELEAGNTGVFFLKNMTYPVAGTNLYQLLAESQGFIQYNKDGKSAKGVFDSYEDINTDLINKINQKTRLKFRRSKAIDWANVTSNFELNSSNLKFTPAAQSSATQPTISGFSPTTVQAGRDVELTINGSGFGATKGTSYVAFKNADYGGATYTQPYSNQYVSWSDTQIVVKVPGDAGTGTILVNVSGTSVVSSGNLTIEYAVNNFPYTYNSNAYEYKGILSSNNGLGGYTFKYTADVPTDGKSYFETAVKQWRCDTKVHFLISPANSSVTSVGDDNENTVDYVNLGASSTVIARAITRFSACLSDGNLFWYVDEIDVEVNSNINFYYGTGTPSSTQYDYHTAVLHELGHANQLGHVIDSNKIMHYSLGTGQTKRTIDVTTSNGGAYWVEQSTISPNCGPQHSTMNCNSNVSLTGSVNSIAENSGSFTITATQDQNNYSDVVVNFSYSGNATSGTDYTAVGSIVIPAGSLSAQVTIPITNDSINEGNETIIIDIASVINATENDTQQITVTINDQMISLTASVNSIAENGGSFTVTASQNQNNFSDVIVNFSYSGSATSGTDYTAVGSITIPAGSLSSNITIPITDDSIYEGNETIIIDISSVTNATENGTQQVTITINDNETVPYVYLITDSTSPIPENSTSTRSILVRLTGKTSTDTTVILGTTGTANYNTDYTLSSSSTTIVIPAGSMTTYVTFKTIDDVIYEGNETATINISSVTGGNGVTLYSNTSVLSLEYTINDNETIPSVNLTANSSTMTEGSTTIGTITATLSSTSAFTTTVYLVYTGTAIYNTDYELSGTGTSIVIPAGVSSASVTMSAVNDTIFENSESAIIDISSVTNANENATQQQTITILDNDTAPNVTLSIGATSISENNGSTNVTATLSDVSGADTIVNLGFSGSATETTDYTLNSSITIPAGSLSASINLNAVNDFVYEGNENILISITTVENGTEDGLQQKNVTINEDETYPTLSIATTTSSIAENGGSYTITASLSNVSAYDVVFYILSTGDAQISMDFNAPFEIVIPAGSTSVPITVNVTDDALYENDEIIKFDIGGYITNASENGVQQVSTTLISDEVVPPTVSLSISPATIAENGNIATVTATLSTPNGSPTILNLGFSGSATFATDYISDTTITIPAGQSSASLFLNLVNDTIFENNETVTVAIVSVTNAIANESPQQTITITDDDSAYQPTVSLSVNTTSVSESATTMPIFTATLSAVSGADTIVNLSTGGTAIYNTDYTLNPASIVIPAGSLTGTSTLSINNDALYEISETANIQINTVTNGSENGAQSQTVTITNDDAIPTVTLSIGAPTVSETGGATVTITSTLSEVSGLTATSTYTYSGTASNGSDYTITGSSLIPAGSLSSTRTLNVTSDALQEGNETVTVDITGCFRCIENGIQQQTITILDDDLPSVTLSVTTASIDESNTAEVVFTATLTTVSIFPTTINLSLDGTAINTTDYSMNTLSIVIPAGSLFGTATLTSISDTIIEGNETIVVAILSIENGFENGIQEQTVTLIDDDFPNVTLTTSTTSISENAGTAVISANLSSISFLDVTVNLGVSGTASLNSDYTLANTITIPAGSSSASITLSSVNDTLDEVNETVIVDITSVTNGVLLGAQQQLVTITDDDVAPTVTLTTGGSYVVESGSTTVTAKLSAVSGQAVTVNLGLTGTATVNTDYTLGTSITIPAGSLSTNIILSSVNDTTDEVNETVTIDITSVTNGIESGTQQKTVAIIDDDIPPTVTLTTGTSSIIETSGTTTVTATLSAVSSQMVTVNLGLTGTATITSDYTLATSITIPAGSISASIVLNSVNNVIDEADETVIIDITTVTNGLELGTQQKTITIFDDDTAPTVTLTAGTTVITETSGAITITATLSAVSSQVVTANLGLSGTATTNSDYTLATSIAIPAGSLSASINLNAINDTLDEVNETVIVNINSVINGTEFGTQQKTITLIDDDPTPNVTLITGQSTIAETSGTTFIIAALSAVSGQVVTVNLGLSGTATLNSDYTLATSIVIPAGSLSVPINLNALTDSLFESNETVIVDITSVINGTEFGTQQKIITITDDDVARTTTSTTATSNNENHDLSDNITIYPNPSTGVFTIQLKSAMQIEVYTIFGQLLVSKKMDNGLNSLDISENPAGTYFVKTIENGKVSNYKIIKN